MTAYNVQYLVGTLAREADIPVHLTPHGLRHSAITIGLDAGVSLRDMQDFARHADPKTTRRYDRSRHALNRHATYAIAHYLAGGNRTTALPPQSCGPRTALRGRRRRNERVAPTMRAFYPGWPARPSRAPSGSRAPRTFRRRRHRSQVRTLSANRCRAA